VAYVGDVGEYARSAIRFSAAEAERTFGTWRAGFAMMAAVPAAALVAALRDPRLTGARHVVFAGVLVLLLDVAFLRDELGTRVSDVLAPTVVIAAALLAWVLPLRTLHVLAAGAVIAISVAAGTLLAARGYGFPAPLDVLRHAARVTDRFERSAPEIVPDAELLPVVGYLRRCTAPSEAVMVVGFGPQVPVLAQRSFAGGLPAWLPGYYQHPADVAAARRRLSAETVGAVVMLEDSSAFAAEWPELAAVLQERGFDRRVVRVGTRSLELWLPSGDRHAGLDPASGLPCRQSP
jgi:hypothetical protein